MHWLKEFRLNYIKKNDVVGISREELARMVQRKGVGCSAVLIGIIEGGGITHPNIADKIAAVAGASKTQRDSMVNEVHRGKGNYKPPKMKPQQPGHIRPMAPGYVGVNARPVVMLDRNAVIIGKYASEREAALAAQCSVSVVGSRCNRKVPGRNNEFSACGYTFRWLNEWEGMSVEERIEDMRRAEKKIMPYTKAVVMLDRNAVVCGCFETIPEAARMANCLDNVVATRCNRKVSEKTNEFITCGYTFRWQKEWESMSAEERIEDMRRAEETKRTRRNKQSGGCN